MSEQRFEDEAFENRGQHSKADAGAEPTCRDDADPDTPATRPAPPTAEGEKPDQLAKHEQQAEDRQEALIDESVEETFPASDPATPKQIT